MRRFLPSWKLGPDFDSTVLDTSAVSGADARTLDRIDDSTARAVAYDTACLVVRGSIER